MNIALTQQSPASPEAAQLITELEAAIETKGYPSASRHGFSVEKLLREGVAFFVARYDGMPAGCGGVKLFGIEYGEVKRMFVRPQYRGLGVARAMLDHLAGYARAHNVAVLRLETGIYQTEAIELYEHWGFRRRPPFGEYREDPLSVFFEKHIV